MKSSGCLLIIVTLTQQVVIHFRRENSNSKYDFLVPENIQARVKHKVAKTNRDKTQQSVYEAVIREINNITAEDWSRAIGNI